MLFIKSFVNDFLNTECRDPIGLSESAESTQITASSVLHGDKVKFGPEQARLNGSSAWRPFGNRGDFLTVTFFYNMYFT